MRKYGNGGDTDPKKLTPAQWKEINKRKGFLPVNGPRPSPHGEFYDPNKWYQTIDDKGNVIDLPYESYTNPTKAPAIDPNRKPLDLSNPSFRYDPNLGRYFNPVTGDEIKPIVEQYKKGGKVKGYAEGGSTNYSERFNAVNQVNALNAGTQPATQPNPYAKNTGTQVKNAATGALGAYGTGYFAAQTANPETSSWRTAGLAAVSQAGPIGAVIGGAAGIGDQIGKPIKAKNERMDAEGNLIDPESARRGAILGGLLSPSKALEQRMSYKGGFKDLTGKGYINHLEAQEKERLAGIYNQENQLKLDAQKEKFGALVDENLLKRDAGITGNTFKDGGEIKGKGTGTSDSITAKVKPGSFIVPEANSATAKLIRKQILGKVPNKTANLNQAGGQTVKLSNGEEMFTPEEVQKITDAGYDLNALAPESKDKLRAELNCGGVVKRYGEGGKVDGKNKRESIYVSDKNDPRYKSYQDSLNLYNKKTKAAYDLINGKSNTLKLDKINKTAQHPHMPNSNYRIDEYDGVVALTGLFSNINDEIKKTGIKPVGYQEVTQPGVPLGGGTFPVYKKPVQSVEIASKSNYLAPKGLPNTSEPDLNPKIQPLPQAPKQNTRIITGNGGYNTKQYLDDTGKVVREEYYDMSGNKIDPVQQYKNGGMIKKYAKGGTVGDDDFVKKEKAKIEAERKADAKKLGESRAKVLADKKYNDLNYAIRNNLTKQLKEKKEYEKTVSETQRELDALKKSYKLFDEQSNTAINTPTSEVEKLAGANSKPNVEDVRKNREDLLAKIKEKEDALNQAKTKLDYASNEKNYINDTTLGLGKTKKAADPFKITEQKNTTTESLDDPALINELEQMEKPEVVVKAKPVNTTNLVENLRPKTITTDDTEGMTAPSAQSMAQGNVPQNTSQPTNSVAVTEPLNTTPSTNSSPSAPAGARQGFNVGNAFGTALTYGIPLAQTIIGLDQLKKAGDRPVDKIDQDVLNAVDKTKKNALQAELDAKFGMTAAQAAELRMQNQALLNTERYNVRNMAGGSSGNALNYERAAANDSFGRTIAAKIYDDKLKQQKQQIAYGLQDAVNNSVAHKQELNRRLFGDVMNKWQQQTNAAANLTSTGLGNLYDSAQANNRLNRFNQGYNNANGI